MKVSLGSDGVPIVVTYRKILRKPKLVRQRSFVGGLQMVKNILAKVIELIEDSAFETRTEVIDQGQSVSVHWAITVEDPWDPSVGVEKGLVAYRMMDDIPPSGVHFEVISGCKEEEAVKASGQEKEAAADAEGKPSPTAPQLTPEQFRALRSRQEAPSRVNGASRASPAPEYGPRRVKTIEEEAAEAVVQHEDAPGVGRSSLKREDD